MELYVISINDRYLDVDGQVTPKVSEANYYEDYDHAVRVAKYKNKKNDQINPIPVAVDCAVFGLKPEDFEF